MVSPTAVTPRTPLAIFILLLLLAATSPVRPQKLLRAANTRTLTSQASSSSFLTATQRDVLKRMNYYRSWHGAAPLKWSKKLQDSATKWANKCIFKHSGWNVGENLAWNYQSWAAAIDAWYYEIVTKDESPLIDGTQEKLYDYNKAQWSESIGHFTQIVWKGTTSVGCAYSCQIYVCQYEPPGNVIGYFAQNVGRRNKG